MMLCKVKVDIIDKQEPQTQCSIILSKYMLLGFDVFRFNLLEKKALVMEPIEMLKQSMFFALKYCMVYCESVSEGK